MNNYFSEYFYECLEEVESEVAIMQYNNEYDKPTKDEIKDLDHRFSKLSSYLQSAKARRKDMIK